MSLKKPWEYNDALTEQNLIEVCNLIVSAYNEVLDYRLPEKGDNKWALGCRRYAWAKERIRKAVESGLIPCLSILKDQGNTFIFLIGEVPVKFKCTDPDDPDDSVIRQSAIESQQLSLLELEGLYDPRSLRWRIAVEDDYDGEVLRVAVIGITENKMTECFWEMPRDRIVPHITTAFEHKDEGVDLDAAFVDVANANDDEVPNNGESEEA